MFSLKHLLPSAMDRAHATRQVNASLVLLKTDAFLRTHLPAQAQEEAHALAFTGDTLVIGCRSSSVCSFLDHEQEALLDELKRALPQVQVKRIFLRTVNSFSDKSQGSL
jgi:hypothetical protein